MLCLEWSCDREPATQECSTGFPRLIGACESFGPYRLINGLAVNCYVEPVYTWMLTSS
jgi:hypothetical protein